MILGSIDCIKVGDIFEVNGGTITVIHYENAQKIYVKHNDEHAHCMWTSKTSIRRGRIKNPYYRSVEGVGFLGEGKFKCYVDGKITEEYYVWKNMLLRAYNEKFKKNNPTYKNVTVCEEWHNFQEFAYWYTREDEYGRGYHLDKDIIVKGNKCYNPDTCCLVPQEINSFFCSVKEKKNGLPTGVYKKKNGKFEVVASKKQVGTYKNLEDAIYAYSNAKGIKAKELAISNLGSIRYKVFLAIMNWEF